MLRVLKKFNFFYILILNFGLIRIRVRNFTQLIEILTECLYIFKALKY